MNKSELIAKIAEKAGLTKEQATAALSAFSDTVVEALKQGDSVKFVGFGTFDLKERAAYVKWNPLTQETTEIPAKMVATFRPGKALKVDF